jgi:DNA-binding SARP family transcriptional activator
VDGEVQIAILGPLEVRGPRGEAVDVSGSRLRTLLIQLALQPGRVVTQDQLVAAIWDGDPPDGAANALQSLVSRLRRALPGNLVESHASGYRLAVAADAVDAHRFEMLARRGRAALTDDPASAARILHEALGLWRGPALADAADAAFSVAPAARLAELQFAAAEDRIEADLLLGRGDRLIAELESLVAGHPLRERLRGQHMRALFADGRSADALRAYDEIRRLLGEQLGADPSAALQELHVAVLRGDVAALGLGAPKPASPASTTSPGSPAVAQPARRTNVRAQLTSFVGRDRDLARIEALLARARLVTITWPGGAGKTRLAFESADRLSDRIPDGDWVVELAPVGDAADVPHTVLAALQIREQTHLPQPRSPAVSPVERLVGALADKQLLLILDNCEHLVADVAALVDDVLARCPGVRVLATSRESLGITGESLYPLARAAAPAARRRDRGSSRRHIGGATVLRPRRGGLVIRP